jgi:flavin reductase (DIM6/NTAB) family NADH-FMN oxidoreductase RutF
VNETDAFGISVNDDIDKFEKTGLTPVKAEKVDAPYVGEFPVVMECRLIKTIPIGSHIQIIGEIVDLKIDENILDSDGHPTVSIINPLGFDILRSEYYSMGGVVGKAYDCGRKYLL